MQPLFVSSSETPKGSSLIINLQVPFQKAFHRCTYRGCHQIKFNSLACLGFFSSFHFCPLISRTATLLAADLYVQGQQWLDWQRVQGGMNEWMNADSFLHRGWCYWGGVNTVPTHHWSPRDSLNKVPGSLCQLRYVLGHQRIMVWVCASLKGSQAVVWSLFEGDEEWERLWGRSPTGQIWVTF